MKRSYLKFLLLNSKISQLETLKLPEFFFLLFFSPKFKKLNISAIYKAIIKCSLNVPMLFIYKENLNHPNLFSESSFVIYLQILSERNSNLTTRRISRTTSRSSSTRSIEFEFNVRNHRNF